MQNTILLPDAWSIFKVNEIEAQIVRTPKGDAQQLLMINTSIGVDQKKLQAALSVYLLPTDRDWESVEQVRQLNGLQQAKKLELTPVPQAHPGDTLTSFQFKAETGPKHYILVNIDADVAGEGGYKLRHPAQKLLVVPEYPKEIRFLHQGALLALSSEHKVSLSVRGFNTIRYEIGRVLPKEINHLVTQTAGNFANPEFDYKFSKDDISEIFSKDVDFAGELSEAQYTALDLDQYLKPNDQNTHPLGLFLLKVQGVNRDTKATLRDGSTTRLILVTDMSLIVKHNLNKSIDVFVSSISSGLPVQGAKVAVLGKNGLELTTKQTDSTGHVQFPTLSPENYTADRTPVVITATQDTDVAFIPFDARERELNYSKYDIDGVSEDADRQNLSAFLFTDRGIYRPGEISHIGMIVKQTYAQLAHAGIPLELKIVNPQGKEVLQQKFNSQQPGFSAVDFATPELVAGKYEASLYIIRDKDVSTYLGGTQFLVQDFLPDTMKITSEYSVTANEGWVSPSPLQLQVQLSNLDGTPSAEQRVVAHLTIEPRRFEFKAFADYVFNDPYFDKDKHYRQIANELPEQLTNEKGAVTFELPLAEYDKASYALKSYVQGFEKNGGRSVSTQVETLVSPLAYLVGYKADGDYSLIKMASQRHVNMIAINSKVEKIAKQNLKAAIIQMNNIVTLVKQEDGTYKYQSSVQEQTLYTQPLNIPATGLDYPLPTDKIGSYVLAVYSEDNLLLARIPFVVGGNLGNERQKNAELTIALDKQEYQAGEDIQLQINAPYSGSGLITLERDKVYAFQWFTTNTTNSLQKIRIPADFIGNGYVNVSFIRDWNSPEIFASPLSYAVTPFRVDAKKHTVNIKLNVPETARGNTVLPLTYQTDDPAKIVVYAVDEGILQVANYHTPDPLAYFFKKRALSVETQQIADLILPKFVAERELSAIGGDDGASLLQLFLNPFKRKNQAAVVYWSGIIDSDSTPKTLNFPLPNYFNGTLRVMAVAVNERGVGHQQQETVVQNDFVIKPNAPTFAAPNDEFSLSVGVVNKVKGSNALKSVIQISPSKNLQLMGEAKQTKILLENKDANVSFKFKALNQLGEAAVNIKVSDDKNHISEQTLTLSIRPAVAYNNQLISGYEKTKKKSIATPDSYFAEKYEQYVTAGNSPLIFIAGLNRFLETYPYECTEQLTSRAMSRLVMQAGTPGGMQALINKILTRQNDQGAFQFWPGMEGSDRDLTDRQFLSIYVMHFLTEARAAHYDVAQSAITQGLDYLRTLVEANPSDLSEARLKAYAIYVLTRNEIVTSNYLTELQVYLDGLADKSWSQDILIAYMAASYQLLRDEQTANRLIKGYHLHQDTAVPFFSALSNDAQYVYLLALHFPQLLSSTQKSIALQLADKLSAATLSTTEAAYNALALAAFAKVVPASLPSSMQVISYNQANKVLSSIPLSGTSLTPLPASQTRVEFQSLNHPGFFYQFSQAGFLQKLPSKEIKEGIEISREYFDKQNNKVVDTKVGDELTVRIHLRSLHNETFTNIAVVDLLPAGFEIIPDSFEEGTYHETHEDRALFFGSLYGDERLALTYRIRAVVAGRYTVPAISAQAMYNARVRALSSWGTMAILERNQR